MARHAKGKRSYAISDRSGFKVRYRNLKTEWNNLRVEPSEYEPKHPQLTPPKNIIDAQSLFQPRPDNDPENISIFIGFNWFAPKQSMMASDYDAPRTIGIRAEGNVGKVEIEFNKEVVVTGVGATILLDANNEDERQAITNPTGLNATGNVGVESFETEQVVTGVAGTSAVATVGSNLGINILVSGVEATGNIGTELIEQDNPSWGTGTWGGGAWGISLTTVDVSNVGVEATGNIGTETPTIELTETGVAGTGTTGSESINIDTSSWGDEAWGEDNWGQ
tara:strand:+ start:626 stop:1462 length:837 start_codon:yes stop_codon:yes gene_type:complete